MQRYSLPIHTKMGILMLVFIGSKIFLQKKGTTVSFIDIAFILTGNRTPVGHEYARYAAVGTCRTSVAHVNYLPLVAPHDGFRFAAGIL